MLMSAVAGNVYAQSVGQTIKIDGVTYTYEGVTDGNRWVSITGADATVTGDVTFPSTIRNEQDTYDFEVRQIKSCDFGSNEITSLTLPEGLKTVLSVGIYPGIRGSKVKVINIPASVTSINDIDPACASLTDINVASEHSNYSSIDGVLFNKDKSSLVRYPKGKTAAEYTVPEGVVKIRAHGIINDNLTSLNLASTTTTTDAASSITCPNLTDISIPAAMTTLPALTECKKLQNYWVADGNPNYSDIDGVLCNEDGTTLVNYPLGRTATEYTIPSSVKTIGEDAFLSSMLVTVDFGGSQVETIEQNAFNLNYSLTSVLNLPESLRTISKQAFQHCTSLSNISFPEGLETIGTLAFENCNLKTVNFPSTLKTIGENAFLNTKLTSVFVPAGVTSLSTAFKCPNITRIDVSEDNPNFASIDGVVFSKDKKTLIEYPRGRQDEVYEIPEGTETVGNQAFGMNGSAANNYIQKVTIPSTLKQIGESAFRRCGKLSTVEFPENSQLKTINGYAFSGDAKLTEFELPASVSQFGQNVLGSTGLTVFNVPDNSELINLYGSNFANCSKLTEINVGNNTKLEKVNFQWCSGTGVTKFTIGEGNSKLKSLDYFNYLNKLETIEIAEDAGSEGAGITIQANCFKDMTTLTSLALPAATTTLEKLAFSGCTNLTSVTIADTEENPCRLKTIGENVFYQCGIESFTVPSSVESIAYEAFRECPALTTVEIPAGCTSVDKQAFEATPNLTAINVDKANPIYASSDGIFCDKMKEQLIIYPAGKAEENFTLLPPSLTSIGEMSFFNNPNLKNVMIPKKVTSIAVNAFNQCSNLKNIVLLGDNPEEITIGTDAFLRVPTDATVWLRYDQQDKGITDWNGFTNFDYCKMSSDEDGNHQYEFFPMADGSANVLSVKNNTTDYTLVMPETVSDGQQEYTVDYLGDYMLEDAQENIKEVVVKHTPKYIGALAFNSAFGNADAFLCDDVDDMSTIRFEYDKETFNSRYNEGQNLYMKQSVAERVLADESWTDLADVVDYHIPLPAISTDLGTFSREFAVDLDAINPDKENPQVIAFTAGRPYYNKQKNLVDVHMVSINHTGEDENGSSGAGDGTYIPANTGVLLKAYAGSVASYDKNAEGEDKGAFYQIAEEQTEGYHGDNCMGSVTVKSKTIQPVEDGMKNFIISGGKLWSITKPRNMTVHKAYLQVAEESVPEGANIVLTFSDPNSDDTDAITSAELSTEADADGYIYNLQGQRVNGSAKGLYIKNGKKYIKK